MTTREEFASFIRTLCSRSMKPGEWERLVVTHYADTKLEDARRELVKESIEQGSISGMRATRLSQIIDTLEYKK